MKTLKKLALAGLILGYLACDKNNPVDESDNCEGVVCGKDSICVDGTCVDTTNVDTSCVSDTCDTTVTDTTKYYKKFQAVDCLLRSGIPSLEIILNGKKYVTDDSGYVNLLAKDSLLSDKLSNFDIKDENNPNSLGNYFDVKLDSSKWSSMKDIPAKLYMIPIFDDIWYNSENKNNLEFLKRVNGITENYPWLKKWRNLPIKVFHNRAGAPNQMYRDALDSALTDWENKSSFTYKGNLIPKTDIFTEVASSEEADVVYDYSSNFSHTILYFNESSPYYPTKAFIYINNSLTNWNRILRENNHEPKHVMGVINIEVNEPDDDDSHVSPKVAKNIATVAYSLPEFQDMSIYKSD